MVQTIKLYVYLRVIICILQSCENGWALDVQANSLHHLLVRLVGTEASVNVFRDYATISLFLLPL